MTLNYCVTYSFFFANNQINTQAFHITSERVVIITVGDTNDVSDDAATIEKHDSSGGFVIKQQTEWLLHLFNVMIKAKQLLQGGVIKRSFGKLKESDNDNNVDSLPMEMAVSDATQNLLSDEGKNYLTKKKTRYGLFKCVNVIRICWLRFTYGDATVRANACHAGAECYHIGNSICNDAFAQIS